MTAFPRRTGRKYPRSPLVTAADVKPTARPPGSSHHRRFSPGTLWLTFCFAVSAPTYNNRPQRHEAGHHATHGRNLKPPLSLRFPRREICRRARNFRQPLRLEAKTIGPLEDPPGPPRHLGAIAPPTAASALAGISSPGAKDLKHGAGACVWACYTPTGRPRRFGIRKNTPQEKPSRKLKYCIGDTSTTWHPRAKDGHPAPFNSRTSKSANEDNLRWRDRGNLRRPAYMAFYGDAIKAKYPQILVICVRPRGLGPTRTPDVQDEHYY